MSHINEEHEELPTSLLNNVTLKCGAMGVNYSYEV